MTPRVLALGAAEARTAEERRERAVRLRAELKEPDRVLQAAGLPERWDAWPPEWREAVEERAGIMEFDGRLPRQVAEREAEVLVRGEFARRAGGPRR